MKKKRQEDLLEQMLHVVCEKCFVDWSSSQ